MADNGKQMNDVIRAAGGLVWRDGVRGKELLIIHRERYDDWTLPKGKQDAGEPLLVTAVREVREETGYDVHVEGFAGAIAYEVDGNPKVVTFWQMRTKGKPAGELDDEVDTTIWLPVDEAWERLQYPLEKVLVDVFRQGAQEVEE